MNDTSICPVRCCGWDDGGGDDDNCGDVSDRDGIGLVKEDVSVDDNDDTTVALVVVMEFVAA